MFDMSQLSKEDIQKLRKTNISNVAKRLEYYDEINKKENAIDLVKRVNGFTYNEAIAWLFHEFGEKNTADFITENALNSLRETQPKRPFTESEIAIKKQVEKQLSAIDSKYYRITCMSKEGKETFLTGKKTMLKSFIIKNK